MSDVRRYYFMDLGYLARERALEANQQRDHARNWPDHAFEDGRALTFCEVISLMINQSVAFGISPEDLRLDGLEPIRDLP